MTTYAAIQTPTRTNAEISAQIRKIASEALAASGGRGTIDYQTGTTKSESGTGVIGLSATALRDRAATDPIVAAKLEIMWLLLDPRLNLVGRVAKSNNAVSETMQERIRVRLEEVLEQKVLQNPPTGLDLKRLIGEAPRMWGADEVARNADHSVQMLPQADPIGWATRLLYGSLSATTKRVMNNEKAQLHSLSDSDTTTAPGQAVADITVWHHVVGLPESAEEQFIRDEESRAQAESEDAYAGDAPDALEHWREQVRNRRGVDKLQVDAEAIHAMLRVPRLMKPATAATARALHRQLVDDPEIAARALKAYHDLADGVPTWDQRGVSDEMLQLWSTFTVTEAAKLLGMDGRVPALLASAAVVLPPKPAAPVLKAVRAAIQLLSNQTGWIRLSSKAINAYFAAHYAWFSAYDNIQRTGEDLTEMEALAAEWPQLASEILAWPNNPADASTIGDVASWIEQIVDSATPAAAG